MARPIKHNADYFSHDCNMRNDMKIKALRRKYKHRGYAVYIMMLELLTEHDYFEIEWNEMNIELLTPDFDIDAEDLNEIIDYCIKLNLFQITNGYLHCNKLTERLEDDLLSRRKGYNPNNAKRNKLMLEKPNNNEVNVNINQESKVKEIKEKEIEINESEEDKIMREYYENAYEEILNEQAELEEYYEKRFEDKSIEATEIDRDSKEILKRFDNMFSDI